MLVSIVADARKPALDTLYAATMAGILDGASEGVRAGEAAAAAMINARMDDGFMDPFVFDIGTGPATGGRRAACSTPIRGSASSIRSSSRTRHSSARTDPNRLTSTAYWKDFKEVKELGSLTSTVRTADQTNAAIFWQFAPAPLWNRLLRDLSMDHDVDTVDTARLMAMVNLAAADGAISCWNDKYYWNFWRPKAAIREADTDGNNKTVADPDWQSLFDPSTPTVPPLSTPPFPDHPSGHGCLSGSVLHTVRAFFGTDRIAFDMHSGRFPDQPRHFERFSHALKEIIDARVWGGIHFRTADEQGATIGKKVPTGSWSTTSSRSNRPDRPTTRTHDH